VANEWSILCIVTSPGSASDQIVFGKTFSQLNLAIRDDQTITISAQE
jgi:hypothetical protein